MARRPLPRREVVVLVHGIWKTGRDLWLLARRLKAAGYDARVFAYASLRRTPARNAEALVAFLRQIAAPRVHLVGHSLGGIVVLHALARARDLAPGRVVLLGSPVRGSAVARLLARTPPLSLALGRSVEAGLLGDAPRRARGREVLSIAGALPLGIGRVLADLPPPHDGTVSVAETLLAPPTVSLTLPVSHTGLILSRTVAQAVVRWLGEGRVSPADASDPALP